MIQPDRIWLIIPELSMDAAVDKKYPEMIAAEAKTVKNNRLLPEPLNRRM